MADEIKEYLDEPGLIYYNGKLKKLVDDTYVKREKKTGSDTEEKVLSDNNLTDELLQKIEDAADATGDYNDLENIPTLDGTELKGTLTKVGLNIASKDDLPGIATTEKAGLVKPDGETIEVDLTGKINVKDGVFATEEYVDSKLSSTYKPAGSIETIASLPTLTSDNLGKVYNVEAAFVTTENFIEGTGKDYPAGTNVAVVEPSTGVYKYDALSGFMDMSEYMKKTSIQPIPTTKIDALFV